MDLGSITTGVRELTTSHQRWFGTVTSVGWALVILGSAAWLLGWWFGWDEFMYLAAGAFLAFAIALAFTFGRTDLEVTLTLIPQRVTVGAQAVAEVVVTNMSDRRMFPVRLEVPVGRNIARIDVPTLPAGGDWDATIVIPTIRRSVIKVGPVSSVRSDPLDIIRREITWTQACELFVHPVTTPLTRLASGWMRDLEGQTTRDLSNSDLNFHALREYSKGDDRRHIHWKTSARLRKWMIRQFVDTRRSHVVIMLSTNPSNYSDSEEFEVAVSIVASLALRSMSDAQSMDLVAGSERAATPTGQAFMDRCSRVELGDSLNSIQEIALIARSIARDASIAVIVAGSATEAVDLRRGADRFSPDVRAIGIRVSNDDVAHLNDDGRTVLIEAGSLRSFAQAMWTVNR